VIFALSYSTTGLADRALDDTVKHFAAGVAYLEDPDGARYEEAYAEFKKAYELSQSPKVLGNLGLCAMKLERDGEAIEAFTRYLTEVDDVDPEERAQSTRDLQTLLAGAVHVSVSTDLRARDGASRIDIVDTRTPSRGAPIANVYSMTGQQAELVLRPGRHTLAIRIGGVQSGAWEFDAGPGARLAHTFAAQDARDASARPTSPTPSRVGPILFIGVGVAALAAGGVLGLATLDKVRSIEDKCPNDLCPPATYDDELASAHAYVRTTDYLLLGGGVAAAVGLTWFVVSSSRSPASDRRAPVAASVACASPFCGGVVKVGF
jgi:hypothetical protein